jgi:threonine dehydrogenase-like Zn-dependent dehydrogenase
VCIQSDEGSTLKAVTYHGKHDLHVESVDDPRIEEPTDAIVRITSTAICGSDLHLYSGRVLTLEEGDIIGHEPMGIVEAVGPEVKNLKAGDRVVVPFNISCGHCFYCDQDLYSQCETTQNTEWGKGASFLGYSHMYGGVPGGQAEYLRVPHADFGPIKVPESGPDEQYLFLSDVLPTAWQAVQYADVERPANGRSISRHTELGDERVLAIYGLGPIGQACVRIAKHMGIERVIGVDTVPERLEMAKKHGASVIDFERVDDPAMAILEATNGRGADSVIDAVGMEADGSKVDIVLEKTKVQLDRPHALRNVLASARRGGTVSLSGVYVGPIQMFPLGDLFDRQIQLRMGQANVREWTGDILPLLEDDSDPLGMKDFVTHQMPLEEAPDAYDLFQNKKDGAIKIVLKPHGMNGSSPQAAL